MNIVSSYIIHCHRSSDITTVRFMQWEGIAYGTLYVYDNNPEVAYLCDLSVHENERKKGLGRDMQEVREKYAKESLNSKIVCLWVAIGSWQYDWYIRRGYKEWMEKDENTVWLMKFL